MQKSPTWREILADVIKDRRLKQRIIRDLHINPATLARWVNANEHIKPRTQYRRPLLNFIPQDHRARFQESLAEEFEDPLIIVEEPKAEVSKDIPSDFYATVLNAYSETYQPITPSPIYNIILQQALAQLDPDSVGMSITVALCLPPAPGNNVRTLREGLGRGTYPWESHLESQPYLLGADSLAGYAVSKCQPAVNQNLREGSSTIPFCRTEWEESTVVYPILRGDRIAGALIVSSHLSNYFTPTLQKVIQKYAHLMVLACSPEEFYEQSRISLGLVPHPSKQPPYFAKFHQRVTEKILWARQQEGQTITRIEAETRVWQDLEEELIQEYLQSTA
jgi:hypothetical protein